MPGGTGGGIKTTTFGTIVLDLWTSLRGQVEVTVFHRRLPAETVAKAYLIAALAFFWLSGVTVLLLAIVCRTSRAGEAGCTTRTSRS